MRVTGGVVNTTDSRFEVSVRQSITMSREAVKVD